MTPEKLEEVRAKARARYWANRDRAKAYYRANREKILVRAKVWAEAHPERVREYSARYYRRHREESLAYWARYYEANGEGLKAKARERNRKNPVANRDGVHRARMYAAPCAHAECLGVGPLALAWERFPHVCYLCAVPLTMGGNAEFDHVIPLSRGGLHCVENVRPCCRPCNQRKGRKLPV